MLSLNACIFNYVPKWFYVNPNWNHNPILLVRLWLLWQPGVWFQWLCHSQQENTNYGLLVLEKVTIKPLDTMALS